jgi:hypothetical protein
MIFELLEQAVGIYRMAGLPVADLQWLADEDRLEVLVDLMPDGYYAEFADAGRVHCWCACNGITRVHRSGWCHFKAEHADLDCGCYESFYEPTDEDWAEMEEWADGAELAQAETETEEPF